MSVRVSAEDLGIHPLRDESIVSMLHVAPPSDERASRMSTFVPEAVT